MGSSSVWSIRSHGIYLSELALKIWRYQPVKWDWKIVCWDNLTPSPNIVHLFSSDDSFVCVMVVSWYLLFYYYLFSIPIFPFSIPPIFQFQFQFRNWNWNWAAIPIYLNPGPWFNIKISSYQYRKTHCGDKTVVRSSYLHNGISYTGKMSSLYWIGALVNELVIEILKTSHRSRLLGHT